MLNVFDLKNLAVAVFDDADLVATYPHLKTNIIDPMPSSCQKIYVSSVPHRIHSQNREALQMKLLVDNTFYPQHILSYFIKAENESRKLNILSTLINEVCSSTHGQMLIFFTVS